MADVKHCTASPINDFEGFLHIFYCWIKNFTESLTDKLLHQVGWQGRVQNNRNSPQDVQSPDCWVLTQTYSPNFFSSRFWWAVVSFTALDTDAVLPTKETRGSPFILLWGNLIQNLSLVASHQVSVHLAKQLQRIRFLEIDQSETRMACGGHVY